MIPCCLSASSKRRQPAPSYGLGFSWTVEALIERWSCGVDGWGFYLHVGEMLNDCGRVVVDGVDFFSSGCLEFLPQILLPDEGWNVGQS